MTPVHALLFFFGLAFLLLGLFGCGWSRDQQTKTVEVERFTTAPIILDTPVGQIAVQATQVTRQRQQDEVVQEDRRYQMPEVTMAAQAVAGATPWGGILAGGIGLLTTAFAGKKALDNRRQLHETIDGLEAAKAKLPPEAWSTLTTELGSAQNSDTKAAVQARTA